jgi:hypothetical protein
MGMAFKKGHRPHNTGKGANLLWLRERVSYQGDECLIWPFAIVRGYGQLQYRGKITRASRVMCIEAHGEPPTPEHQAAHDCGNCACVNPTHIRWKTPSENQLDKRKHGTFYNGGRRKRLSDREVMAIRLLHGSRTQDKIAEMFGVSRRNIGMIVNGHSRKTVAADS